MADPDSVTPPPSPSPSPAPAAVPPLKPGLLTSEGLLTLLVAMLALLPGSGLFPSTSPIVKLAGLLVGGLSAVGYQYQRTQLKLAHLRAQLGTRDVKAYGAIGNGVADDTTAIRAAVNAAAAIAPSAK